MRLISALFIILLAACGKADLRDHYPNNLGEHFVKLDDSGASMPNNAGPWSCLLDKKTGLVWEVKKDDEQLHFVKSTYSWTGATSKDQGASHFRNNPEGSCNKQLTPSCTSSEFIRVVNRNGLCGFTDWRLPTVAELQSLLAPEIAHPQPKICPCVFPYVARGDYWSADLNPASGFVATFNFSESKVSSRATTDFFYVMLVRSHADRR